MDKTIAGAKLKEIALQQFYKFQESLNGKATSKLNEVRKNAFKVIEQGGFPSTKDEEWKYTNIKKLVNNEFAFDAKGNITAEDIHDFEISDSFNTIVFVNGQFDSELSYLAEDRKFVVSNMEDAFQNHSELFENHFGRYAKDSENAFVALNTSFSKNGAFIHVPKSVVVEKPIMLLYVADTKEQHIISQPRNLFVVEENAQISILEHAVTLGENESLLNAVTEISIAPYANVNHYKLQLDNDHASQITNTFAEQADNSVFSNTTITTGGKIVRNNLSIGLGEHCESHMNGLYLINGKSLVDNHTVVDHQKPNSYSNELYKGILDEKSKAVFNGKIFVREHAQKTNAFQSNKNILLSDDATVNTKPQLEIWADDVSCSHGCTVGALDEDPMFYLRSRGIPEDKARALLMYAFAADVFEKVKTPAAKSYIEKIIANRLEYPLFD